MIGNLSRIPEEVRSALHQNPSKITGLLYPEFVNEPVKKPGFLARLFGGKKAEPVPATVTLPVLGEEDSADLDKTWHVLHFLLTGTAWEGNFPANFLVTGGQPVGDVDVGYGPARSFSVAETAQIHLFLQELDLRELRTKLNPKEMEDLKIYPGFGKRDTVADDEWGYFAGGLETAMEFVAETARQNKALLVYLN